MVYHKRPWGFFCEMSDRQLLNYTFDLHGKDIGPYKLERRDMSLYQELRIRKLTEKLKRKNRPKGFLSNKNDKELLEYTFNEYEKKITRRELIKRDGSLYNELAKRALLNKIENNPNFNRWPTYNKWKRYGLNNQYNKTNPWSLHKSNNKEAKSWYIRGYSMKWMGNFPFNRKNRLPRDFKNMSNKKLLNYVFHERGRDITRRELYKSDYGLYREIIKRKLRDKIKNDSDRKEKRYWLNFENFSREMWEIIKENDGDFPKWKKLKVRGGIANTIFKYYSSKYNVMEKIGYNEQKRIELAKQLEEIVREIE